MVRQSLIMLALLNEFVYEYRGNNTYVIQEKTALCSLKKSAYSFPRFMHFSWPSSIFYHVPRQSCITYELAINCSPFWSVRIHGKINSGMYVVWQTPKVSSLAVHLNSFYILINKGGFHLHLLVFPFVYQFNSRIGVLNSDSKWMFLNKWPLKDYLWPIFAICMLIFHKTEVLTVILRCLTGINYD